MASNQKQRFRVYIRSVISHTEEFDADDENAARLYADVLADELSYDKYKHRDAHPTVAVTKVRRFKTNADVEQKINGTN